VEPEQLKKVLLLAGMLKEESSFLQTQN